MHCIYSSAGTVDFSEADILEFLGIARENNTRLGVTGMLLYEKGSFFQIMEGHLDVVGPLLKVIEKDTRHDHFVRVIYEQVEARSFSQRTMSCSNLTLADPRDIEGMNDFFLSNQVFTELDEGRAKALLEALKQGKWRATTR